MHVVGEVTAIDSEAGRLEFRKLERPLYKGKAPTGKDAGNWQDTLVPIERADIVEQIFGDSAEMASGHEQGPTSTPAITDLPLNLILYGPPGTGKTYELTHEYVKRFQRAPTKADADVELMESLTWFEVTVLALQVLGGKGKVAELEQHPFVKTKHAASRNKDLRAQLWATLQSHTVKTSTTVNYAQRTEPLVFEKTVDSVWQFADKLPDELQGLSERLGTTTTATQDDFTFVTFHQAYGYEDFIEGIRPRVDAIDEDGASTLSYVREDGAFLKAVLAALRLAGFNGSIHQFCTLTHEQRAAQFHNKRGYAVFIDEINRGNVSRIFGELITLLEDDKRLGAANEVIVHLPGSRQKFGVPPNLHVIGTMNTADRSIEAIDTALRRRFEFRELPPRPDLLTFEIAGIEIGAMLVAINQRLERLCDRDHCIGHAYLYALKDEPTLDGLKQVFRNKLVPLLQEYFYGDWGKIGLVLGKDFVRRSAHSSKPFADFDHDDHDTLAERTTWELTDIMKLDAAAFQRIYSHAKNA